MQKITQNLEKKNISLVVHGFPGVGKTSLLASVKEKYKDAKEVGALLFEKTARKRYLLLFFNVFLRWK